jgi:hypothetical protein
MAEADLGCSARAGQSYAKVIRAIRESRNKGGLWRYGRELFEEALKSEDQSAAWARRVIHQAPTHFDRLISFALWESMGV